MILDTPVQGQRFLAPEVIQTSEMDCGPAALKSILEGFGIPVNYGRLREACQTDVDGTSINTIEDLAVQLGLQAEQVMLPLDHILLSETQALPALVVVRLPNGMTHFLVVWGRFGNYLQIMDPATGRRWPTWRRFQDELYIHSFPVPAEAWREWAGTQGFLAPLSRRLGDLQVPEDRIRELIDSASQDLSWRSLASLDAATRMVAAIVRSRGLETGEQAGKVISRFYELNRQQAVPAEFRQTDASEFTQLPGEGLQIPETYWSVLPLASAESEAGEPADAQRLVLRGAVLVRILGRRPEAEVVLTEEGQPEAARGLSPDLEAALGEPEYRPLRSVWNALRQDGLLTPTLLLLAVALATMGVMVEALLFQGLVILGQNLSNVSQRIAGVVVLAAFMLALLLLEFPISSIALRMGRRLETRLRVTLLEKIPRLGDRYFRSRLTSDMAQRAHDLRALRSLPLVGVGLLRTAFQLVLTTIGVIWLDPISAPLAIVGTLFFFGLSFITRPFLEERDLRLRTHVGALSRFYLDSLLGLIPAKTHGAERSLRRQHESQMVEWVRSNRDFSNIATYLRAIGALLYSLFAILILVNYVAKGGQPSEILLLFYWTLNLPALGQSLADQIQQYPMLRNRVVRLLEPLGAPDEEDIWLPDRMGGQADGSQADFANQAIGIEFEAVTIQAGGHVILKEVSLQIQPGEHIAIVGPSGAGKSSLVGLLLGWNRPAQGRILVDQQTLDGKRIQAIRQETAWVDPAVQLWNRSLYENLRYGMEHANGRPIGAVIKDADLFGVLERLPDGLKTSLGEAGGLVSGGEGQRVRLGRAMYRSGVRLAILDEPFRGLDREKRRLLLVQAREHWSAATLLCITHDVSETLNFPRVIVIEEGKIIEDGAPQELAEQGNSRYRELLEAEEQVRQGLWASANWQRLWIENGFLTLRQPDLKIPGPDQNHAGADNLPASDPNL